MSSAFAEDMYSWSFQRMEFDLHLSAFWVGQVVVDWSHVSSFA